VSSYLDAASAKSGRCAATGSTVPLAVKGRQLVDSLKPFMISKDNASLYDFLRQEGWTEPALIALLACSDMTIIRAATWCLAHVGSLAANLPLASVLHHDDAATVELAENALWSVWLRGAALDLHQRLCAAIRLTEQDCLDKALAEMDSLVKTAPDYAEAFNQRAIVRFLKSDYPGAIQDYQQAAALNPIHFGALAGVGHCHAALGRYNDALNAYRHVLAIHPRMEGIRQAITQIRQMLSHGRNQTGRVPSSWATG
jgi:tetratricopeptide (TPR) repeat protein